MTKEPTTAQWEAQAKAKREAELIRRYRAGEPLTKADKREAAKLVLAEIQGQRPYQGQA